jgi:hypothetical protein
MFGIFLLELILTLLLLLLKFFFGLSKSWIFNVVPVAAAEAAVISVGEYQISDEAFSIRLFVF